jgi:hypothetical protein
MNLEEFFDKSIKVGSLAYLLDKYLAQLPPDADHADDSFWHCSMVSRDMCPRYETILRVMPKNTIPLRNISADLHKRFDIGTAVHSWWQNKYLGPMGVLYGIWKCSKCHNLVTGFMPQHSCICSEDHGKWEYVELTLTVPLAEKPLRGHCDGVIKDPITGEWYLVELKTCDPFVFSKLTEPDPNYIDQVILYLYILLRWWTKIPGGRKEFEDIKFGRIVYINKSTGKTKEFDIKPDHVRAATLLSRLTTVTETLLQHKNGVNVPLPEKHGHCTSMLEPRAKNCNLAMACFQSDTIKDIKLFYEQPKEDTWEVGE